MPVNEAISGRPAMVWWNDYAVSLPLWTTPLTMMIGLAMLLLSLHGARGIGAVHGAIAKHLLVRGG
jgi:hypothetical protein